MNKQLKSTPAAPTTALVELNLAQLKQVSGGAPRGTWGPEAHTAPKAA